MIFAQIEPSGTIMIKLDGSNGHTHVWRFNRENIDQVMDTIYMQGALYIGGLRADEADRVRNVVHTICKPKPIKLKTTNKRFRL